jgi:hypothetical protein
MAYVENPQCKEPSSKEMEFRAEHQEGLEEDAAVKQVGGLKKRRKDHNLAAECSCQPDKRTRVTVEHTRYWPPPTERWLSLQVWHGAREASSGDIRPGTMLKKKLGNDGRWRRDAGKAHNAKRELWTLAQGSSWILISRRYQMVSTEMLFYWS